MLGHLIKDDPMVTPTRPAPPPKPTTAAPPSAAPPGVPAPGGLDPAAAAAQEKEKENLLGSALLTMATSLQDIGNTMKAVTEKAVEKLKEAQKETLDELDS
jgi:hypothetical protein